MRVVPLRRRNAALRAIIVLAAVFLFSAPSHPTVASPALHAYDADPRLGLGQPLEPGHVHDLLAPRRASVGAARGAAPFLNFDYDAGTELARRTYDLGLNLAVGTVEAQSRATVLDGAAGTEPQACGALARGLLVPRGVRKLTDGQAASLARFNKKLPKGSTGTHVDELGDGVMFTSEVPGTVPGSKAVYQKVVDANGVTISFTKTTFDPQGNIVHAKDKLSGGN